MAQMLSRIVDIENSTMASFLQASVLFRHWNTELTDKKKCGTFWIYTVSHIFVFCFFLEKISCNTFFGRRNYFVCNDQKNKFILNNRVICNNRDWNESKYVGTNVWKVNVG